MAQSYSVTVNIDSTTLASLQANNWNLRVFMGAQCTGTGTPVVWNSINYFSSTNTIEWDATYGAYFASNIPIAGGRLQETTAVDSISIGQIFVLNSDGSNAVKPYPLHAPLLALLTSVDDLCCHGTRQNKYSRYDALTPVSV
jgi:hypothetical protein